MKPKFKPPPPICPLSDSEKRMKDRGIGRASGYWEHNAQRRRALGGPVDNREHGANGYLGDPPLMVWPSKKKD